MKNIIAIIPARSGSKRIKNKNIKLFNNKPIIYYPIKIAKKSRLFKKIIVTTNSIKIKKIALKSGADDVVIRPKNLSNGKSLIIDAIKHAINVLEKNKIKIEYVCCIFPTSALLQTKYLTNSFKLLKNNEKKFIFSAVKFSYPIEKSFKIRGKKVKFFKNKNSNKMTQQFDKSYHDAGQFYWGKKNNWKKEKSILSNNCGHFLMPEINAIDIDTVSDWKIAEAIHKKYIK